MRRNTFFNCNNLKYVVPKLRVLIGVLHKLQVMERLDHAMKRGANVIAEYLGGATTCDAHHMTEPRTDGLGVSSCITKSLEDAGVSPEEVCMVSVVVF